MEIESVRRSTGSSLGRAWRLERGLRLGLAGLLAVLCAATSSRSAESSVITLRDGTTVNGEVISLHDGLYTVWTPARGTVTIRQSDVSSLTQDVPAHAPASAPAPAQLDAMQARIAADPETMKAISAMQDTPELKEILDDPEVMSALKNGDLEVLLSNPKLARLAADPRVQEITKKFSQ